MSFRLRAFLIHFAISGTIAVLSLALVFRVWHPWPLARAVGVTDIFLLLIAIDAILGPALTLIVAKQGKKSLRTDLAVIALLQASAYFYGMYHIAVARPVWLAFDTRRFEIVQQNGIDNSTSCTASGEYKTPSWFSPQWIAVRPARDDNEKSERLFYELGEGFSPAARPCLYQPLDDVYAQITAAALPLAELEQYNAPGRVRAILAEHEGADGFLPLKSPVTDMVVLLDSSDEHKLWIVDLRPWE